MREAADDLVVSAIGAVAAPGPGAASARGGPFERRETASPRPDLAAFEPGKHLSDRRLMKAIAKRDGIGLVALEDCLRQAGFVPGTFPAGRTGLYVGAPAASTQDAVPYDEALRAAVRPSGDCDVVAFGRACESVKPTALLLGLPNNVLCYGSILMDAQGPNSNYTAGPTSGHLALLNAARRLRRGQLAFAVAGGITAVGDDLHRAAQTRLGLLAAPDGRAGTVPGEGAVFVAMERRESAAKRGLRPLVTFLSASMTHVATGPFGEDDEAALDALAGEALAAAGAEASQVGLVLVAPPVTERSGRTIAERLGRLFPGSSRLPALACLQGLGQLGEASGLLELAAIDCLYGLGRVPESEALGDQRCARDVCEERPLVLVVVGADAGDKTCVLVRREPP